MKVWFPIIRARSGTDVYSLRLAHSLKKRGIEAVVTWFPRYFEFVPFLLRFAPAPKVDLIHTNSWNGFAFYRKGIPLIVTAHHSVHDPALSHYKTILQKLYHRLLIRLYEKLSFRLATKITAVSEYSANMTRSLFHCSDIAVVYNFVDYDLFRPNQNSQTVSPIFRLLYVGTISDRKGSDLLIPIADKLGEDYSLTIISYNSRKKLRFLSDNIQFISAKNDSELVAAYQNCDAVIFPTRLEGFGLVVLEAMACGKPVIASRNSSLPELVEEGVTGILCDTNSIDDFSNACAFLRINSSTRIQMGNKARERANSLFSEAAIISQYVYIYKKAKRA